MFKLKKYMISAKDVDKYPKFKEAMKSGGRGSIMKWEMPVFDRKLGTFKDIDVLVRIGEVPNQNYHYVDYVVSNRFLDNPTNFELLLNDHLCFHNTHMRSLEEKIVFYSLVRKIIALAFSDIQLIDYNILDLHGPDGLVVSCGECVDRIKSYSNVRKCRHKFGIRDLSCYYDVLINALFNKIFGRPECPYKELLEKKIEILGGYDHVFMNYNAPSIINHSMGKLENVVYHLPIYLSRSLGYWDKEETENIYFVPNDDLAYSYTINNNRRLDMYIDMIVYYIKHDFDIEYTLANYEYYKKPKTVEHSNKYGSYVIYRPSKYNMYRHYQDVVPGMSKTISYLHNNTTDIVFSNIRHKLLNSGYNMIMYEDNEHTKLDREWLISNNSNMMFNPKALHYYYEKENSCYYNEEAFAQEFQNSPLFTYKERIKITEYKIKFLELLYGKYGYDKTKHTDIQFKHFCNLIDEELPQPELARVFINR